MATLHKEARDLSEHRPIMEKLNTFTFLYIQRTEKKNKVGSMNKLLRIRDCVCIGPVGIKVNRIEAINTRLRKNCELCV